MTTIAITGGKGFIGRETALAAQMRGCDVIVLDHPDDVREHTYKMEGADHVIHLAGVLGTAELFGSPHHAIDVNIGGTVNVLGWCAMSGATFTGITMPPVFPSVYTATKVAADRMATAWHHAFELPVSKVRAFNAYGAGQKHGMGHPQKILPTFATEAWAGRPIPIWGDGEQLVDLISVRDIARMLVAATQYGDDQTFDAGTGHAISVNELADFVIHVTGSNAGVKYLPMRKGEIPSKICAEGEGWDLLGWQPAFSWTEITSAILHYEPK